MKKLMIVLCLTNIALFASSLSNKEKKAYNDVGVHAYIDISWAIEHKISPEEIKAWTKVKPDVPEYVTEIGNCKRSGLKTPDEFIKWKKAGAGCSSGYLTKNNWTEAGINSPEVAEKWYKLGITPLKYDFDFFREKGLTYKTLNSWKKITKLDFHSIIYLINNKFTLKEYEKYKGINIENAIKLKEWNITPNKLIASMNKDFYVNKEYFLKAYNKLKGNCQEIQNHAFAAVDMYDNKDKCYTFYAKLIQRVDKHHGLAYTPLIDKYIYLNFNGNWIEGSTKPGIVKGNEAFSFVTKDGYKKSVPQGKVIFFYY